MFFSRLTLRVIGIENSEYLKEITKFYLEHDLPVLTKLIVSGRNHLPKGYM